MAGLITVLIVTALALWRLLRPSGGPSGPGPANVETEAARPVPATYKNNVQRWEPYARRFGKKYGIPWEIIAGIIWTESTGDPAETGSAGEVGLMQLKKNEAVEDVRNLTDTDVSGWARDPIKNIEVGTSYLALNLRSGRADGDIYLALRMYNQGPSGAYRNALKSRRYADKVLRRARSLGYNG